MSVELVALAVLMFAVTYPSRALPLLLPGIERLPGAAQDYLRLIGPAMLAALAAVNALTLLDGDGVARLHLGVEALAVVVAVAVVAWRRNLLLALLSAVVLVATVRAMGIAG